ncbi:probable cytochrome P450 6a13 [Epargyreus clarus]|uniref:probable cytochrome P450 6a13 n=1 Tax=Epargyreus clarus TaxID=520877 RepID=UPI003C2BBB46
MLENPQIKEDPFKLMYTYTTACISSAVFGIDEKTWNTMETPFNEMAYQSVKPTFKFSLKFAISYISPKLYKLLNLKAFGEYEELFIEMMRKVMEKRRRDEKIYHDFIDICLKLEDEGVIKDFVTGYETDVTIQLLAAQAFVFILAGIDSSANALHFTLLELSNNPKILQKLQEEIDEIFKNNGGNLVYEDIDRLEYMEKVINEVMRKYPPIGSIQRRCCKETILPVGGIKVEKDTIIFIPVYALHRDEKYFPNPDVFDPERFSVKNLSNIVDYSYLPFGEGKRNCIGTRFARIEMKAGLAWLLRKYTLKEQSYTPDHFEPSFFGIRDPSAYYEIIPRVDS